MTDKDTKKEGTAEEKPKVSLEEKKQMFVKDGRAFVNYLSHDWENDARWKAL